MLVENIRQFYTIIDGDNDELYMIRQIALSLKQKLNIDIVIADKKGNNLLNTSFKPENYFYKIPLKAMTLKYGMIYANGIDGLSPNDLALFYSAVPLISILLKNIYTRSELYIKQQIRAAIVVIGSLTLTELKALKYVFETLDKTEGTVIISKIASNTHITRSVIVNALKKIESAGIIDSRSLGMKGTKIKVNNKYFITELRNS